MPCVYILWSASLKRHYVGSTELNGANRLQLHLEKNYGSKKFTAQVDDWTLKLELECTSIEHARKVEKHIKRMKSAQYIGNLLKYPEMRERLLTRYAGSSR